MTKSVPSLSVPYLLPLFRQSLVRKWFLAFPPLATLWKKLVLLCPCLSQLSLNFCFQTDFFLVDGSSFFNLVCSNIPLLIGQNLFPFGLDGYFLREYAFCWIKLPKTTLFQIFRFCLIIWNFCWILWASQPCIWVWYHKERIDALQDSCFFFYQQENRNSLISAKSLSNTPRTIN